MNVGEKIRLTLRALKGPSPPINRLRMALKSLLRSFGFRCERIDWEPEKPDERPKRKT